MSTSSNPRTPRQSEVDSIVDILDQFYLNVNEQSGSIEEQEDIYLYNLYDRRTPKPCLKSPNFHRDSSSNQSIDQDILASKLKSYMESISLGNKGEPRVDSVLDKEKRANLVNGAAEAGREGTVRTTTNCGCPYKN
ncbi:hypothetical protein AN958_05733 [Leucoagaricus sp. SymC.cos]|nr:hypothetical protein AN958_05733 [Leucoagaricus sp. SymC.cos]